MSSTPRVTADTIPIHKPRPRLPSEHEARLVEGDQARANCYTKLEEVTEQLREVADGLSDSEDADDGIPIVIDTEDDYSLVTSIDGVRALVR